MKKLLAIPIAVFTLLFSIACGLGIIHATNFIYEIDVHWFGLIDESGYTASEAEENVEAALSYLSPFSSRDFDLSTMEFSEKGASHFEDCKVIFDIVYIAGLASLIGLIVIYNVGKPSCFTVRAASVITVLLPLFVFGVMLIDFDSVFVIFHKILFRNADWLFDPALDPIILVLPAEFFLHCAIFLVFCIFVGAGILWFSRKKEKKPGQKIYVRGNLTNRALLNQINSSEDLKKLKNKEMVPLAAEIRDFLVEQVNVQGGHLASNLGVVELTLAVHRNFTTPKDHIIWDVGHQSYVHKIITGRRERFDELRMPGGLSGFTKISESEHDCFGAGHSSTSLSAALGFAESDKRQGSDAYTVVVLGDGAFTGGMIHEAINNCRKDLNLIILLNENEMSISKNKGGFADYMSNIRTTKKYFKVKAVTENTLEKIPFIGNIAVKYIHKVKQDIKNIVYSTNYFEDMGLYYIGPVDGNDYNAVSDMIQVAKKLNRSTVIHITTKKGYGYKPAEDFPQQYHAVPKGGVREEKEGFSDNLGRAIYDIAVDYKDICAITAAMPHGTGLEIIKHNLPERFYDVGIAEEHAATFAAGLCANKMRPYFAVYSSFLQRAYDNVIHDIALQKLPVTICVDRSGLNEGDGATHHGIFDVSFLSAIPNMEIYTPSTYDSLRESVISAYRGNIACAIRYPRGAQKQEIVDAFYPTGCKEISVAKSDFEGKNVNCVIITYGNIATEALKAEKLFSEIGIECGTVLLEKIKPYDICAQKVASIIPDSCETVVFLEEGIRNGGAAQCLWDKLRECNGFSRKNYIIHAIDDDFVYGEKNKTLIQSAHITAQDIIESYKTKNNL
ncbi:MAG: 1-deoxy-D-xylulose-5-phosphate synthase [Clostridia bacterium]|nr:1-deoxy-D-xylulose-5-phosphate synthase [Clostridia bacterium]